MLNSNRLPELGRYMAFLEACGVRDTQTWAFVWRKIMLKEREAKVGAT
jgi:hypothetical protein